jgi:hypothetical protein
VNWPLVIELGEIWKFVSQFLDHDIHGRYRLIFVYDVQIKIVAG